MSIQTDIAAAREAYNLASHGGASIEACNAAFAELVAAKRAAETDEQKVARLNREADAHNACADRHEALSSEFYDKAAIYRNRALNMAPGMWRDAEMAQAKEHQDTSDRHQACCDGELAEALRCRREAALIKSRVDEAEAVREIAR